VGCLSFALSFVGTFFTQRHEILSRNTRYSKLSYGANLKYPYLSHLGLERFQDVTPGQTARITVANTRYSYARSRA